MIEVENLVKKYGSHTAVDHLSFKVEKGRIYGFLGPNGAGKSTTMNIMTGYIAPSSGTVKINGFDIIKDAENAKRCIGYLPELPPLYQDMTVKEYLCFTLELKRKMSAKDKMAHINEIMEQTMILDVKDRLIKNLSKGYKQRVGLAQAMLGNPDVIILDEPTVGLDPKQIIEIRELIRKMGEKHTVILSSHILSEVQAVCDEIMIISKGRLVASDTPEGLLSLMQGSVSLEVQVLGEKEKAVQLMEQIPELQSCMISDKQENGCIRLLLETDGETDIREKLFYLLAENKIPIMSLNRMEKSLEDIFLTLTSEEQEPVMKVNENISDKKGENEDDSNI